MSKLNPAVVPAVTVLVPAVDQPVVETRDTSVKVIATRKEAIKQSGLLRVTEKAYAGALVEHFGIDPIYDGKMFFNINQDTKPIGKNGAAEMAPIKQEIKAYYAGLRDNDHSNPSTAKGRVWKYANEIANPTKTDSKTDSERGANGTRPLAERMESELSGLYKAFHNTKYANDKNAKVRDAHKCVELALHKLIGETKTDALIVE